MSESMHMEMESADGSEPRKKLKMGSTILDSFTKLVKDNERERLNGGIALLRHMSQKKMEETESKELNRALTRLVRGLGSSRALSRKSFYTVLTAYLRTNPDTSIEDLLKIMDNELRPVNSNAKSENADIYTGRILLCGSLIRSKLLITQESEMQQKIFEILFSSGQQRSYLSFVSIFFLANYLDQTSDANSLKSSVWPLLKKMLGKPWEEQTLDTLYILLLMKDKFPSLVGGKFLKEHLGHRDIINGERTEELLKLLTNIPRIACCRHPVFKLVCERIVSSEYLIEFWSGIDLRFVKPSKSMEYLGLELFKHILTNIQNKTLLPSLLSEHFLHHMIRRFTNCKKNRQDEIAITFKSLLSQLVSVMNDKEIKPKTQVGVLKKLILYPGDIMIEKITGTKVIQMLTANMNEEGVKRLSKLYIEIASNARSKEKGGDRTESWTNAERVYVVQLLTRLLGHPAVSTEHKWRLDQLKFLFNLGLCQTANVGAELAPNFKESFYRALDHKLPKLDYLRTILSELIHHLNEELFVNKTTTLRTPLTDPGIEAWNAMMTFITKLEKDSRNEQAVLIFYTMDLHMGLQLFSDPEMAISAINEIHACSKRLSKNKSKKEKRSNDAIDEPEWVDVIVDLLLSLLSRNSHLLRSMVKCVFPHVCTVLTATSIHQIISVLDPKNDKSPLGPNNDETSDESSEGGDSDSSAENDDDEDTNHAKKTSLNDDADEADTSKDSDNDSDKDTSDDDDDDADVDDTVTDRLRLAVHQALGDACMHTDHEDIDVDQIDEDQGKRLDESLAAAFRILRENRQTPSKKQEKSAQSVTHFRVRVIDLLETYIDSGPSMALALDMLVPLFALLEYCIKEPHQKPLENRVRTCLKKLSAVKKFKDAEGVDAQLLTDVAKLLMEKGERSTSVCQEMGDKLAECATFLIRCAQQASLPDETLVQIYAENLTAFFKKRDCVLPAGLFKSALQLFWVGNWQLAPLLVDFAFDNTIRSFRRGQALEFLTIFYRNNRLVNDEKNNSVRLKMEKKLFVNSLNLLQELASNLQSLNVEPTNKKNAIIGKEVRQKFVCLLMTLLHAVHPQHLPKAWDWKLIANAVAAYRTHLSLSKDTRIAYNRLASQIGAPINVTTNTNEQAKSMFANGVQSNQEENVSEGESDNEETATISQKSKKELKKKLKIRSKQKDKQKLKKEARELRAKAMSVGLESLDFSTANFTNGNAEDSAMENGVSDILPNTRNKTKKRSVEEDISSKTKKKKKLNDKH